MSKRKASAVSNSMSPELSITDIYDLLPRIGSYFTGKQFSTFLLAVSSSKVLRGDDNDDDCNKIIITIKSITTDLLNRCTAFLDSINASDRMKSLLRDRLDDVIAKTSENGIMNNMKQLSEWCAFLDYCELTPLRLSEDLGFKQEDGTIHPLWLVGYGTFGEAESKAILSVPSETWSPELYFLAGKWMGDYVQANPKLKSFFDLGSVDNDDIGTRNIGTSAAVMSWSDLEYLKLMHYPNPVWAGHDIGAGFVVYHKYPIEEEAEEIVNHDNHCYLNWLPNAYCDSPTIGCRRALGESKLQWMAENTVDDDNMLRKVEVNTDVVPTNHMDSFGECIIDLMKKKLKRYA